MWKVDGLYQSGADKARTWVIDMAEDDDDDGDNTHDYGDDDDDDIDDANETEQYGDESMNTTVGYDIPPDEDIEYDDPLHEYVNYDLTSDDVDCGDDGYGSVLSSMKNEPTGTLNSIVNECKDDYFDLCSLPDDMMENDLNVETLTSTPNRPEMIPSIALIQEENDTLFIPSLEDQLPLIAQDLWDTNVYDIDVQANEQTNYIPLEPIVLVVQPNVILPVANPNDTNGFSNVDLKNRDSTNHLFPLEIVQKKSGSQQTQKATDGIKLKLKVPNICFRCGSLTVSIITRNENKNNKKKPILLGRCKMCNLTYHKHFCLKENNVCMKCDSVLSTNMFDFSNLKKTEKLKRYL